MATKAKASTSKTATTTAHATKKSAAKKGAVTKVAPAKKAAASAAPIKKALNKTQLIAYLAEHSGVDGKVVKAVLLQLEAAILASVNSVNKKGDGQFVFPGLFKINVHKVPARKAHMGINPFTKQEQQFAAKPASMKVKVRALKKLKDAAEK